jgi:hypothetical protein
MATEGFDSEIRIELAHGGRVWGVLVLLRERGRTPFSTTDTTTAKCLVLRSSKVVDKSAS